MALTDALPSGSRIIFRLSIRLVTVAEIIQASTSHNHLYDRSFRLQRRERAYFVAL